MTEKENHFLTLLMGKCWHEWLYEGTCKHCGATRVRGGVTFLQECAWSKNTDFGHPIGFFTVKEWMEKNMPLEWEGYLWQWSKQVYPAGFCATRGLNKQLDLSNLVEYLTENRGWGWVECPECHGKGWMEVPSNMDAEMIKFVCEYCNGSGKVLHPALVWWDKEK